jgi:hypothetical protein
MGHHPSDHPQQLFFDNLPLALDPRFASSQPSPRCAEGRGQPQAEQGGKATTDQLRPPPKHPIAATALTTIADPF